MLVIGLRSNEVSMLDSNVQNIMRSRGVLIMVQCSHYTVDCANVLCGAMRA